jgi:hypothetical protein
LIRLGASELVYNGGERAGGDFPFDDLIGDEPFGVFSGFLFEVGEFEERVSEAFVEFFLISGISEQDVVSSADMHGHREGIGFN